MLAQMLAQMLGQVMSAPKPASQRTRHPDGDTSPDDGETAQVDDDDGDGAMLMSMVVTMMV